MKQQIIITGASDGIGAAATRQLSAKGGRVVLAGRSVLWSSISFPSGHPGLPPA